MKVNIGLSTSASFSEKNNQLSIATSSGFFLDGKRVLVSLILGLSGTVGSDGGYSETQKNGDNLSYNNPVARNNSIAELGPINGGSVNFMSLGGKNLLSIGTNPDGGINYNPNEILAKLGNEEWVVVYTFGGFDTDKDDDGVPDKAWTQIRGDFRVLVHRSLLERNEKIVINPRAGAISESLLGRVGGVISEAALDRLSIASGATDSNGDGIVSYLDIIGGQMKDVKDISKLTPFISGYIGSIHSGDNYRKINAIKNIAKYENHILTELVPNPYDGNDSGPMLKLKSITSDAIIYYTLDGSSPVPGGPRTFSAVGEVLIPIQNKKIHFRERFSLFGEFVLGKVKSFDLAEDWIELSQQSQSYNKSGKPNYTETAQIYKGVNFKTSTWSNIASSGYTYPRFIDCEIATKDKDGCIYGPYIAYNPAHENRIRGLIQSAIVKYIDTGIVVPLKPETPQEVIKNLIMYRNSYYTIYNDWNIDSFTGQRLFPVRVWGRFLMNNGSQQVVEGGYAKNEAERIDKNNKIVSLLRLGIEADERGENPNIIKTKNQIDVVQDWTVYNTSQYTILLIWNTNGRLDTNYPSTIRGIYKSPKSGSLITLDFIVYNDTDRITTINSLSSTLKSKIDSEKSLPKPSCTFNQIKRSDIIYYRTGSYQGISICNTTGNSDYPMIIYAEYTLPNGSKYETTGRTTVYNEAQKIEQTVYHENLAKSKIDSSIGNLISPRFSVNLPTEYYINGSFSFTKDYSSVNGMNYPSNLFASITYNNGYTAPLILVATGLMNEGQITSSIEKYRLYIKEQIDNYNPTYQPNTIVTFGPFRHGTRGSEFTFKYKFNREGKNKNYPALLWVEYKNGGNPTVFDSRNTYGLITVNSYTELSSMIKQLETWVRGQLIAQGPSLEDTPRDIRWKIESILPFGNAFAQSSMGISVGKNPLKFPTPSMYAQNYYLLKIYSHQLGIQDIYTGNKNPTPNMSSRSQTGLASKELAGKVVPLMDKVTFIQDSINGNPNCSNTGVGSLAGVECTNPSIRILSDQKDLYEIIYEFLRLKGRNALLNIGENFSKPYAEGILAQNIGEILKYKENALIMYAIIYEEQSHLFPPQAEDALGGNTLGLSQISLITRIEDKKYFGFPDYLKEDLLNNTKHIEIMNDRINIIRAKLLTKGYDPNPQNIGAIWNGGYSCIEGLQTCTDKSIAYGKRIQGYADRYKRFITLLLNQ